MDFETFIKYRYREFYDASQRSGLQRFGRSIDRTDGLLTMLKNNDASLEPFDMASLLTLADAQREYVRWKKAARSLRRALAQSKLALPDGSMNIAYTSQELEALERTARMCPRSGFPNHDSWAEAVKAHVGLWRAAVEQAFATGTVSISLADPDHPEAADFEAQTGTGKSLGDLAGHRWLGARRGQKAGILTINANLPWDEIHDQGKARLGQMGLLAQKRGIDLVLEELVRNDLEAVVLAVLDQQSEAKALDSARSAYLSLLATPSVMAERIVAIYVEKRGAKIGLAVLDKGGQVRHKGEFTPQSDDELRQICADVLTSYEPDALVLPADQMDAPGQQVVEQALSSLPVHHIYTAALAEARKRFSMGPGESSAIVLGRRALKPAREWSKVDPLSLGLGEYSRELDREKLEVVLQEAKALASRERSRKNSPTRPETGVRTATGRIAGKRLNPAIKTIRDLRPGMILDGIITNITRFGAFVNIGLPTEGMIHVSQLADEFVEYPSQVVRVGQHVSARVIELIPEKHRIALSLKPAPEQPALEQSGPPRNNKKTGQSRTQTKGRTSALADLNALFKK